MHTHGKTKREHPNHSIVRPFFAKGVSAGELAGFFTRAPPASAPAIQRKCTACQAEEQIQSKLTIGAPGDPYEREADTMAERVVGASATEIQRQTEEDNEEEEAIQTKAKSTGQSAVSPDIATAISTYQGNGQSLTGSTRQFFESRFGRDFGDVTIHTDSRANHLARSINARAFTHKSDIYFNDGEYQPQSSEGQRLLAHELTHVMQQSNSDISPKIQCDFAIAPTTPRTRFRTLTRAEVQAAITFNRRVYTNPAEISFIRDVLGISSTPAVVDADFVNAVARYQAQYGLTQNGNLDLGTAERLAREVVAESDFIRSTRQQSIVTRGAVQHTGAVGAPPAGAQGPPIGNVEVRTGEEIELRPGSRLPNVISIEYTGALTVDSRWLQFVWFEMTAATPHGVGRLSGSVPTSSGVLPFTTNPASPNWAVDSGPNNPFYESDAASLRNTSTTTIFDAAGGGSVSPLAQAVFGSGIGATSVTFTAHFDTYLIQNNRAVYVVPYQASTVLTPPATAGGAINVGAIGYTVGAAGPVAALPNNLRTILHTNYRLFRNIQ